MATAPADRLTPGGFARHIDGRVVRIIRGPRIYGGSIWTVRDGAGDEWLDWTDRLTPIELTDEETLAWTIAILSQ